MGEKIEIKSNTEDLFKLVNLLENAPNVCSYSLQYTNKTNKEVKVIKPVSVPKNSKWRNL